MAIDDLMVRTFALPFGLIESTYDVSKKETHAESYVVRDAYDKVEGRLLYENSAKVFQELKDISGRRYTGYDCREVTMSRSDYIRLTLTAKEYNLSTDELLTYCLTQYLHDRK